MNLIKPEAAVYVYSQAVDMRKSINGLSAIVFDEEPAAIQSGALFGGGSPEKMAWVYHYSPGRGHEVPLAFLDNFNGYLHCDGFCAYDTLANKVMAIIQVGYWYHARRKFIEASKSAKTLA